MLRMTKGESGFETPILTFTVAKLPLDLTVGTVTARLVKRGRAPTVGQKEVG
jgi:hypothetical protein